MSLERDISLFVRMKRVCVCVIGGGGGSLRRVLHLVLRQLTSPIFCKYIKCSLGMRKLHAKMSTPPCKKSRNQTLVKSKKPSIHSVFLEGLKQD